MKLLNAILLSLLTLSVYAQFIIHPPVIYPDVPAYVAPICPVTVLDGQSFETILEYAKVQVRL